MWMGVWIAWYMAWCMGGADDGADTANLSGTNLLAMLQQPQPLPPGPPPAMAGANMQPGAHMQQMQHPQVAAGGADRPGPVVGAPGAADAAHEQGGN